VFCEQLWRLGKQLYTVCVRYIGAEKLKTWCDFVQHVNITTVRYVNSDDTCGDNTDFCWTADEINTQRPSGRVDQ
jgi:hypothetical protein